MRMFAQPADHDSGSQTGASGHFDERLVNLQRQFTHVDILPTLAYRSVFLEFLFGKGASLVVDDVERYEPYLMLVLACLTGCLWLSHFVAHWWRKRHARRRLKRMQEWRNSARPHA